MTATLEPTTTASGVKAATGASPADVVRKAKEAGVQVVDLRFTDLPGTWQHFSIPLKELSEELFEEGIWNSGTNGSPNMGHRPRHKEGYFPVPPVDRLQDLRSKIMLALIASGVDVEVHHHEVGTAGQTEIDMRFTTLGRMADQLMMYKYIVKNVCHQHGYTATFMPKPMFGDNGSGMHVHMSLWKDGTNLFFDPKGYALLSDAARWYIGGLIKHAAALLAFAAPTTNSYRRLVPGYEAPINLIYSQRNRSAICRIPVYSKSPKAKRIEFRAPDP